MTLPFFYNSEIDQGTKDYVLNEDTSRHVAQVLRMKTGEHFQLTDGRGNLFTVELTNDHKKKVAVKMLSTTFVKSSEKKVSIAISLLKNSSRLEWFLEKATEIGVNEIIPLICARTEKQHFRFDRMNGILISAMLQSQQAWLPVLHEPVHFTNLVMREFEDCKKFIAHCFAEKDRGALHHQVSKSSNQLMLIGPEGDFSNEEVGEALKNNFLPVTLGDTRLRTETAGIVAASLLCIL